MSEQNQEKQAYRRKMEETLNDLNAKINELKTQVENKSGETREQLKTKIAELEDKRASVEQKMAETWSASAGAWEELRRGLDRAVDDLRFAYDQAKAHFKRV